MLQMILRARMSFYRCTTTVKRILILMRYIILHILTKHQTNLAHVQQMLLEQKTPNSRVFPCQIWMSRLTLQAKFEIPRLSF